MTQTPIATRLPEVSDGAVRRTEFPCFDGYRAIAAMAVLVYHVSFVTGFIHREHMLGLGFFACRLEIGVEIFFLVSAFLLYRPFAVAHFDRRRMPDVRAFARRRALRILPAYWAALTVGVFLLGFAQEVKPPGSFPLFYGLSQIYAPGREVQGIVQAWSLCTEVSFYAFLPIYAFLLGRRRRPPRRQLHIELTGVLVLYLSSVAFRVFVEVVFPTRYEMTIWLLSTTDLFALGMALAVLSAWYEQRGSQPRITAHRAFPAVSWAVAGFFYWVVAIPVGLGRYPAAPISFEQSLDRQALYGIVALFLLLPGVFGPQRRGIIRRALQHRAVQLVGLVSYGIYLWHPWLIKEIVKWMDHASLGGDGYLRTSGGDRISSVAVLAATVAFALAVATVSYVVVERPFLRLKHRRLAR